MKYLLTKMNIGIDSLDRFMLREISYQQNRTQANMIAYLLHQYILTTEDTRLKQIKEILIRQQTKERLEMNTKLESIITNQQSKEQQKRKPKSVIQNSGEQNPIRTDKEPVEIPSTPIQTPKIEIPDEKIDELKSLLKNARELREMK